MIKQTEGFNMTQIDQFHDALQTRCLTWLFTHSLLLTNTSIAACKYVKIFEANYAELNYPS